MRVSSGVEAEARQYVKDCTSCKAWHGAIDLQGEAAIGV